MEVKLPAWLPKGQAVMRFGWYALHQYPAVEFYSNCVDVKVEGTAVALTNAVKTYKLIGGTPLFPANGNQGKGYTNRFNGGNPHMTGPACANGMTDNSCGLTAIGQPGNLAIAGQTANAPPVITPVSTQTGTQAPSNPRNRRCGTTWEEANTKCGTECPNSTDGECSGGEKCWSDLNTCSNTVPTTTLAACPSGKWKRKKTVISETWCQDTCGNDVLRSDHCDSDLCECEGGLSNSNSSPEIVWFFSALLFLTVAF